MRRRGRAGPAAKGARPGHVAQSFQPRIVTGQANELCARAGEESRGAQYTALVGTAARAAGGIVRGGKGTAGRVVAQGHGKPRRHLGERGARHVDARQERFARHDSVDACINEAVRKGVGGGSRCDCDEGQPEPFARADPHDRRRMAGEHDADASPSAKAEAVAERRRCDHRVNEQLSPADARRRCVPARLEDERGLSPVTGDNVAVELRRSRQKHAWAPRREPRGRRWRGVGRSTPR